MSAPRRIGLTGGIGSGKSTVASMFAELAVPVLDLDQVGRDLLAPGSKALQQIAEAFGDFCLLPDGSLERKALAAHCFADAARTTQLNAIMHPLIWQVEEQWLSKQQAPWVIIEASVLLESGGLKRMDDVIVVMADENIRLQRVMQRGWQSKDEFYAILKRQCLDEQRRRQAGYHIENSGSLQHLRDQVLALYELLQQL